MGWADHATHYSRLTCAPHYAEADASQLDLLRDVFALVAYEDPEREDSPVSYLMQASRPHFMC